MSAIAKFPHLVTAEHLMEFGDVLTDQRTEKTFFLKNDSLVDAKFEVCEGCLQLCADGFDVGHTSRA